MLFARKNGAKYSLNTQREGKKLDKSKKTVYNKLIVVIYILDIIGKEYTDLLKSRIAAERRNYERLRNRNRLVV